MAEEAVGEEGEEAAEYYTDAITGRRRKRRGKRKRSRGQYSLAEKKMVRALQALMAAMHYMDGELADLTAREFTTWFTLCRLACERYSFEDLPDPVAEDWEALRAELSLPKVETKVVHESIDTSKLR